MPLSQRAVYILSTIGAILSFAYFRHPSSAVCDPLFCVTETLLLRYFYQTFDQALFQTLSISTSAGFTTTGFRTGHSFTCVIALLLFIGGCAGSTGGGMKVIRVLLLTLQGAREMKRLVHPRAIYPIKLGGRALSQRVVDAVWGFFSVYALVFVVCMLAFIATGMDELSAFSAVAATLNNFGPGLGEVAVHFADVNDNAKWILIASMLF